MPVPVAVSYTHLDVYKRQEAVRAFAACGLVSATEDEAIGGLPVPGVVE